MLFAQDRPRGLFGSHRAATRFPTGSLKPGDEVLPGVVLPGPISGYGGGTFDLDGRQVTPRNDVDPMFSRDGDAATAVGWDASNASLPQLPMKRSGMFGGAKPQGSAVPTEQPEWSASAMGVLPAHGLETVGGLPRRGAAQPYDYEAALAAMLPQKKKRSTLDKIAAVAIPALMGLGGNQAGANAFTANQIAQRNERRSQKTEAMETIAKWRHEDWARQNGADLRASAPRVIGRSMVQYDPQGGTVDELYDGPEDFESYAETMGLEPGTQEYFDAVEDYVLKSDGPTAYEHDKGLDDYRTGNRLRIEGERQGNRESLEGVRQRNRVTTRGLPTYRDANPRPGGKARPTATGPNGQRVEWNGSAWVPAS